MKRGIIAALLCVAWGALHPAASHAAGLSISLERIDNGTRADTLVFGTAGPSDTLVVSPLQVRVTPRGDGGLWQLVIHSTNDTGGRGLRNRSDERQGLDLYWQVFDTAGAPIASAAPPHRWSLMRDPLEAEWSGAFGRGEVTMASGHDSAVLLGNAPDPGRTGEAPLFVRVACDVDGATAGEYGTTLQFDMIMLAGPPDGARLHVLSGRETAAPVALRWEAPRDNGTGITHLLLQIDTSGLFNPALLLESRVLAPGETQYTRFGLGDGLHHWRVLAYDALGNVVSSYPARDTFLVANPDVQPPRILAASCLPATAPNNGATVLITATVSDNRGVASVYAPLTPLGLGETTSLRDDGVAPDTRAGDGIWNGTFRVTDSVLGDTYALVVAARDRAGLAAADSAALAVIDLSPSLAGLVSFPLEHVDGWRVHGNALSLSAGFSSLLTEVRFEYRMSPGGAWTLCSTMPESDSNPDARPPHWGILWDISRLADGVYDIRARARGEDGRLDPSPDFVRLRKSTVDSVAHGVLNPLAEVYLERRLFPPRAARRMILYDGTWLEIPATALDTLESTWVRITVLPGAPDDVREPGQGLRTLPRPVFRRFEREDGESLFSDTVTLSLPYDDQGLGFSERALGLFFFDPAAQGWVRVEGASVDTEQNVVTASVNHFTVFAIFGVAGAGRVEDVVIYPNPFVPNDDREANGRPFDPADARTGILFAGLPAGSDIEILSIAGKSVARIPATGADTLRWDARGDDGREVASGVYLVVLRDARGGVAVKKLMIVR